MFAKIKTWMNDNPWKTALGFVGLGAATAQFKLVSLLLAQF
jgi:hypothetical protein